MKVQEELAINLNPISQTLRHENLLTVSRHRGTIASLNMLWLRSDSLPTEVLLMSWYVIGWPPTPKSQRDMYVTKMSNISYLLGTQMQVMNSNDYSKTVFPMQKGTMVNCLKRDGVLSKLVKFFQTLLKQKS